MRKSSQKKTFNQWLDEHKGIFYKVVRAYAKTHHDQEDLFQEISIQVWRSIPRYKGTSKESTYIYQVALFAAMAWSRKEIRRTSKIKPQEDVAKTPIFQPLPQRDPRLDWLYEQISCMESIDRSLTLLLLEGYSYREISSVIGISEGAVGARLTRIRNKLTNIKNTEPSP